MSGLWQKLLKWTTGFFKMITQFYTYIHYKPDMTPFYVGKGSFQRAHNLGKSVRSAWHQNIVKKYGRKNIIIEVTPCASEEKALSNEISLIAALREKGFVLCNLTDGGEGVSGRVVSEEQKAKARGRTHSAATRTKIAEAHKGMRHSEESRNKISAAGKGRLLSEDHKASLLKAITGRVCSEETRAKMSLANKGQVCSEETRAKLSLINKGKPRSEETRRKLSDGQKRRVYSAEEKAALSALYKGKPRSDETRRKMSEGQKRRFASSH